MPTLVGPKSIPLGQGGPAEATEGGEMSGSPRALETSQLTGGQSSRISWGDLEANPAEDGLGQTRAPVNPLDCPAFKASLSEQQLNLIQANEDDPQLRDLYDEWIQTRANYLVSADAMAACVVKLNRLSLEMSRRLEAIENQDPTQDRKRAKVEMSPRAAVEPTSPAPTSPADPADDPPPEAEADYDERSPSDSRTESSPFDPRRRREPEEEVSGLVPDDTTPNKLISGEPRGTPARARSLQVESGDASGGGGADGRRRRAKPFPTPLPKDPEEPYKYDPFEDELAKCAKEEAVRRATDEGYTEREIASYANQIEFFCVRDTRDDWERMNSASKRALVERPDKGKWTYHEGDPSMGITTEPIQGPYKAKVFIEARLNIDGDIVSKVVVESPGERTRPCPNQGVRLVENTDNRLKPPQGRQDDPWMADYCGAQGR